MCFVGVSVFFQAEDGIRDLVRSRGLGDVYKRQVLRIGVKRISKRITAHAWVEIGGSPVGEQRASEFLSLIHI